MTLRSFLDATQALLVNEYQRLGMNLTEALEQTNTWRAGGPKEITPEMAVARREQKSAEEVTASQNDQALMNLQAMLGAATRV